MRYFAFFILLFGFLGSYGLLAQTNDQPEVLLNDTLPQEEVVFTPSLASDYLIRLLGHENLWKYKEDTFRLSLNSLLQQYSKPFDSVKSRLYRFPWDSVTISRGYVYERDTIPLRWLAESTFIIDTVPLGREPFVTQKTIYVRSYDAPDEQMPNVVPEIKSLHDSVTVTTDTITEVFLDSLFLKERNIQLYKIADGYIIPSILPEGSNKDARFTPDSSKVVISESKRVYMADEESPFFIVPDSKLTDSLSSAVSTLLAHIEERDSILLFLSDIGGQQMPFWLSTRTDEMQRFWVKNEANDSISLWLGNPSKYDVSLVLEDNVNVERRERISADDIPITTLRPQRSLVTLKAIEEIPVFWNYSLASSFTLNQAYFSNWARGGVSSWSSMLDVRGSANYTHKEMKIRWTNEGRMRYGTTRTEEHGYRTNTDNIELNSQFNTDLRDKVDFSSTFYMTTQVAKGYNYPNDSVVISRFLNPGAFTIGVGIEYKPFDKTSINFSPLSYRNTFVLDTANINQTAHGIEADKRSRQELGGQLVLRNTMTVLDGLNMTNAIRLFSGYLDKPQNVDVDWEINLEKQISWFFMVRLNFHMIYDDDILFPVLDNAGDPVLLPDGSPKRSPKMQFKQFLGLTLAFKI